MLKIVKSKHRHFSSLIKYLFFVINIFVVILPTDYAEASSQNRIIAPLFQNFNLNNLVFNEKSLLGEQTNTDNENENYFGLANDNPPEPNNPSYREYNLSSLTQKDLTVNLVGGSNLNGQDINLPHITLEDLKVLTTNNITIDDSSKLQPNDLTKLTYNATNQQLSISLTDAALMKTNGAGTQLILNIKSKDGTKQDKAVIGIWRNYVEHPYFELNTGNNMYLQYMLNNDSTYEDTDPSMTLNGAIPNYRIRDASKANSIIDTMYHGENINYWYQHSNLFIGSGGDHPVWGGYFANNRLLPLDHMYVGSDPKSKKILFQFDTTPTIFSNKARIRVMGALVPTINDQQISVKQKIINYTTTTNGQPYKLSNIWLYRRYDTDLNSNDRVPVYISSINPITNLPQGLYFKNADTPYRLDFLFDVDGGPKGWDALTYDSDMSDFVGKNTTGHHADENILTGVDSTIKMVWPPSQIGDLDFGKSSPLFGYQTGTSAAIAPTIQANDKKLKYVHDPGETSLPSINLEGKVNSTNSKVNNIKLYYLIDQTKIPTDVAQRKPLDQGSIAFTSNDHGIDKWINFNSSISDLNDLKILATPNSSGHTIYIYGIDNEGLQSNLEIIKVLPNIKVTLHYVNESGEKIAPDKSMLGAEGDSYNLEGSNYLPKTIVTRDGKYKLADTNPSLTGSFSKDLSEIKIFYQKHGTLAITQVPQLDFGRILLVARNTSLLPLVKQVNKLEVIDSTGDPVDWKLLMSTTPFYLVNNSDPNQSTHELDNLLKYKTTDNDIKTITNTDQEIGRYSKLPSSASNKNGEMVTTNFQNIWWSRSDPKQQIGGPMFQDPNNLEVREGRYRCTVTWTLENVLE
jgi:hypothetical protein